MAGGCRGTVNENPHVLNYVRDLVYAVSVIEIWAAFYQVSRPSLQSCRDVAHNTYAAGSKLNSILCGRIHCPKGPQADNTKGLKYKPFLKSTTVFPSKLVGVLCY